MSELALLRDHLLHPLIASLLPWRWSLVYARALSRTTTRFSSYGERSREAAVPALGDRADAAFAMRSTWVRLLDLIDAPRSLLRPDRDLRRRWHVYGRWPTRPCLAVSLHYGCGLYPLRHQRQAGFRTHMILERIDPRVFAGLPISRLLAWFRRWRVERMAGGDVIFSGGARRRCLDLLASGESIFALLDNPQGLSRGIVPFDLFGRPIALHTGIVELAMSAGVPIVPTLTLIGDGRMRELHIGPEIAGDSAEQVCAALADWFAELAGRDPAAWHFWPQMQEFEASVSAVKDNAEIVSIRADS